MLRSELKQSRRCCYATKTTASPEQHDPRRNSNNVSREINARIMALGKQHKWEDLLRVYREERTRFNDVNYATIMSQLAPIRHLDTRDATLLELLSDLPQQLKHFRARSIGNTANALAKMRVPKPERHLILEFFAQLDKVSDRLFQEQDCQNIALSAYASAKSNAPTPNLFANLNHHAEWLLREGNPQSIANSVWACGTLRVKAPKLFKGLDHHGDRLLHDGTLQAITNSVWACAVVNHGPSPGFIEKCVSSFMLKSEDTRSLITCCWSLLVLAIVADHVEANAELPIVWSRVIFLLSIPGRLRDLTEEGIWQILVVEAVGKVCGIPLEPLMPSFATECVRVYQDDEGKPSGLHKNISHALSTLGYGHEMEVSPFPNLPGTMAIDIALQERRIAVEVDGPSHFLCSPHFTLLHEYNGPSLFKRRVLERIGWTVINIDYREAHSHRCSPKWLSHLLEWHDVRDELRTTGLFSAPPFRGDLKISPTRASSRFSWFRQWGG